MRFKISQKKLRTLRISISFTNRRARIRESFDKKRKTNPIVENPGDLNNLKPARSKEELMALVDQEKDASYYLNAAFRSMATNEVFMFLHYDYFVIKYDPDTPKMDRLVKGPLLVCDGFPSLYSTEFDYHGIDAAFSCHGVNEAFLFAGASCARISYDLDTREGDVIGGEGQVLSNTTYTPRMFPFLGKHPYVDAAFESTVIGEAYLFQGSQYVLFNYSEPRLIKSGLITDAFPCLRGTIFSSEIGAAFASHKSYQAYLFKDNSYVLICYNPQEASDSYLIVGPEEIVPTNWPSLQGIVPYNNWGRGDVEPKTWEARWASDGWYRVSNSSIETSMPMSKSEATSWWNNTEDISFCLKKENLIG